MVKLDELPLEVVISITEKSCEEECDLHVANYPDLLSYSILSPTFLHASQRLLNRKVYLWTRQAAALWLNQRLAQYPVEEMSLNLPSGARSRVSLEAIVGACGETLRDLTLKVVHGRRATFLMDRRLKSQSSLYVR